MMMLLIPSHGFENIECFSMVPCACSKIYASKDTGIDKPVTAPMTKASGYLMSQE